MKLGARLMDGNLSRSKVKIKCGNEVTSFVILNGACILERGQGRSLLYKYLRRAESLRGHTKSSKDELKKP